MRFTKGCDGYLASMTTANISPGPGRPARRVSAETKPSSRTSELVAYIVIVVGIFIASAAVGGHSATAHSPAQADPFTALDAWRLVTFLTIGYLVSRGLAKSGTRAFYDEYDGVTRNL